MIASFHPGDGMPDTGPLLNPEGHTLQAW